METTIVFVRHAPTLENETHVMLGRTNPALHARGQWHAQQVAEALRHVPLATVISSPLLRARETAEAISAHHPGVPLVINDMLMELDLGVVDGLSSFTAYEQYRADFDKALDPETEDFSFPGGECWTDALERIRAALQDIATTFAGKTVSVVTHGGLLGLWRCWEKQCSLGQFRSLQPKHASISIVRTSQGEWNVIRWNDIHHLAHERRGHRREEDKV